MWVLVVHAYAAPSGPSSEEAREAAEFDSAVTAAMAAGGKDIRLDSKGIGELAQWLFAPRWGFLDDKAILAFEHLDMVLFTGAVAVLPWYKCVRQVSECALNLACMTWRRRPCAPGALYTIAPRDGYPSLALGQGAGRPLSPSTPCVHLWH